MSIAIGKRSLLSLGAISLVSIARGLDLARGIDERGDTARGIGNRRGKAVIGLFIRQRLLDHAAHRLSQV